LGLAKIVPGDPKEGLKDEQGYYRREQGRPAFFRAGMVLEVGSKMGY
jgi:hypothetical protein